MAIVNIRDSNFIKLKSIKKEHLKTFCELYNIKFSANMTETISSVLKDFDNGKISTENINSFIRKLYIETRDSEIEKTGATHTEIVKELNKDIEAVTTNKDKKTGAVTDLEKNMKQQDLEKIKNIENKLKAKDDVDLYTDLDFREAYIKNGQVFAQDFKLNDLDLYFWHDTIKPSIWQADNYCLNVLKALENDCLVINSSDSTRVVNDKYLAHSVLAKHSLPMADFALVNSANKKSLLKVFADLGESVIIKPRFGGWGIGIMKVDSPSQLLEAVELLQSFLPSIQLQILLEKYYPNDLAKWISVVVLGDKVLFGYRKKNIGNSDWKVYDPDKQDGKGDQSEYIEPSSELKEISLRAKKVIGKDIIGFDFIFTDEGYKIIDENGRPGIYPQCLQGARVDIEKEVVGLIMKKLDLVKNKSV